MNLLNKAKKFLENIVMGLSRFWFAAGVFFLTGLVTIIQVEQQESWEEEIASLLLLALLGILAKIIFEHFFKKTYYLWLLYGTALLFSIAYYSLYLRHSPLFGYTVTLRLSVLFFIIAFAMIWIPSLKQNEQAFPRNLVVFIKALFVSFLLTLVLFIGLLAILSAYDFLIASVPTNLYAHIAIIAWIIFYPMYFLALLPEFPNSDTTENENYHNATTIPKFLEFLFSYIMIPVLSVYTLILLFYIFQNIGSDFWENSLLDQLLISFVIVGWCLLLVIDPLENPVVRFFKKSFPFPLLGITVFQGIATINKIQHFGLTDGRYYILLFIFFSIVASLIYFFKHQWLIIIPTLVVLLGILSILPGIDAVSVASRSQMRQLETVLLDNNMLDNQQIIPNPQLEKNQKEKIIVSYRYLNKVDKLENIAFLAPKTLTDSNFQTVFGFDLYPFDSEGPSPTDPGGFSVELDQTTIPALDVMNQDKFFHLVIDQGRFSQVNQTQLSFSHDNQNYELVLTNTADNSEKEHLHLSLEDENGETLADYDLFFLRELAPLDYSYQSHQKPLEDLTFTQNFATANLTLTVNYLNVVEDQFMFVDFYLFIDFN